MGQNLLKNWPSSLEKISLEDFLTKGSDYLFVTGKREDSLHFIQQNETKPKKILDFSGATKFMALEGGSLSAVYALHDQAKASNLISFPGCSAWGIINTLLIIKDHLPEEIFANVNFPQSAIGRSSENKNSSFIHPLEHLHQKEINLFFNKNSLLHLCPNIVQNETGLTFSLMFKGSMDYKALFKTHSSKEIILCSDPKDVLPQEDKTLIHVSQQGQTVCVIGAVNNLVGKKFLDFL